MPRKPTIPTASQTHKTRAALYARVSTIEQSLTGFGLAVQRDRCRAMATVKDWPIVAEFADEGISGTKDQSERPGLAALLASIDAGEVDAVIVLGLDRLGRKTRIVLDLAERFSSRGVALVSCKESLDTSTPQGVFVLTMFAALAQLERDSIVERTTGGRNERGKQDGEKGGRLPYGYQRINKVATIDHDAAPVVRRIFALHTTGTSLRQIAAALGSQAGPQGGTWGPSSVKTILANEAAYRGGPRGESSVCWPAIL